MLTLEQRTRKYDKAYYPHFVPYQRALFSEPVLFFFFQFFLLVNKLLSFFQHNVNQNFEHLVKLAKLWLAKIKKDNSRSMVNGGMRKAKKRTCKSLANQKAVFF